MQPEHPTQQQGEEQGGLGAIRKPTYSRASPSTRLRTSPYRWVILATLMTEQVPAIMTNLSLGILLPAIKASLALTPLQAGWLGASSRLGNALFAIPFSWWLSRYNPRHLTSLSLLAGTVFVFLQGWAPSYLVLLISRALFGVVGIARAPARVLLNQQWFPLREIPLINGISIGAVGIAEASTMALTPFILGWVGGWRNTYFLFALLALAGALSWLLLGRENLSVSYRAGLSEQQGILLRNVLGYRELWLVAAGACGGAATWWALATFWPLYMGQTYAFPLALSGAIFGLTSLGMTPAGLLVGFLSSRTGKKRVFLWAAGVMMTLSSVGMLLTDIPWLLVVLATIGGFSWGFVPIVSSIPYQLPQIKPREVAVASSLMSTVMLLGGALGPVLAGALYEAFGSLSWALIAVSFFPLSISLAGFAARDQGKLEA